MKTKRSTKVLSITASLLMTVSLIAPNVASAKEVNKLHESLKQSSVSNVLAKDKISDRLLTDFKDEEKVTFLVKFKEKQILKRLQHRHAKQQRTKIYLLKIRSLSNALQLFLS